MAEANKSLGELAEELTCPICLGIFTAPVTIPCGHNFCRPCLELTWKAGVAAAYSCAQCRQSFSPRPELKKNTVLAAVVEQFLQQQQQEVPEEEPEPEPELPLQELQISRNEVSCDFCMWEPAARTCLTCMASFCQEHLLPHLESQVFCDHQLHQPLANLQQRKCPEHSKLLEYFCWEHSKCICCVCVVLHKLCQTSTLKEAKTKKQNDLNKILGTLHEKAEKVSGALADVTTRQSKVQDVAERKKVLLREEFSELKELIEKEEQEVMKKLEEEEQRVDQKFKYTHKILCKKKSEFENLQECLEQLLRDEDEITFLKNAVELKKATTKDPFVPYIDFDQKLLQGLYKRAFSLKETVKNVVQPTSGPGSFPLPGERLMQKFPPPLIPSLIHAMPAPAPPPAFKWNPGPGERSAQQFPSFPVPPPIQATPPVCKPKPGPGLGQHPKKINKTNPGIKNPAPPTNVQSKSRQDLLQYAEKLCLDSNTAHKRVVLSDNHTQISVTDMPQNYSDNPQRFTHCSQVLCQQGFSQGIHYWEVDIQSSTFCGIGVAYKSIDRKGADSRLGRNKVSWCIEWFNAKLSAWHNDVEEILINPNPSKVGVLLNCDEGYVIFFSITKKKNSLLYRFQARFTELVYPAFWVFSSNTTLSLCQLK